MAFRPLQAVRIRRPQLLRIPPRLISVTNINRVRPVLMGRGQWLPPARGSAQILRTPPKMVAGSPSRAPGYQVAATSGTWVSDSTLHDGNDVQSTANTGASTGYQLSGAVNGIIEACAKLDFGVNKTVTKIEFVGKREGAPTLLVETSTDDSTWTSVGMGAISGGIGSFTVVYSDSGAVSRSARYIRFSFRDTASGGTTAQVGIMEVWALDASGVLPTIPYVPPAAPSAAVSPVLRGRIPLLAPAPVKSSLLPVPTPKYVIRTRPVLKARAAYTPTPNYESIILPMAAAKPVVNINRVRPALKARPTWTPTPNYDSFFLAKPPASVVVTNINRVRPVLRISKDSTLPYPGMRFKATFLPKPPAAAIVNINRVRPVLKARPTWTPIPNSESIILPIAAAKPVTNINRVRPVLKARAAYTPIPNYESIILPNPIAATVVNINRVRPVLRIPNAPILPYPGLRGKSSFLPKPPAQFVQVNINRVRPILRQVSAPVLPPPVKSRILPVPVKFVPVVNFPGVKRMLFARAQPQRPAPTDSFIIPLFRRVFPPVYQRPVAVLRAFRRLKHIPPVQTYKAVILPFKTKRFQGRPQVLRSNTQAVRFPVALRSNTASRILPVPVRRNATQIHRQPIRLLSAPRLLAPFYVANARILRTPPRARKPAVFVRASRLKFVPFPGGAVLIPIVKRPVKAINQSRFLRPSIMAYPSAFAPLRGRALLVSLTRVVRAVQPHQTPLRASVQGRAFTPPQTRSRVLPVGRAVGRSNARLLPMLRSAPAYHRRLQVVSTIGRLAPLQATRLNRPRPVMVGSASYSAPARGSAWIGRPVRQVVPVPPGFLTVTTSSGYGDLIVEAIGQGFVTSSGYGDPITESGGKA